LSSCLSNTLAVNSKPPDLMLKLRLNHLLYSPKALVFSFLVGLSAPLIALDPLTPAVGSWNVAGANANWSTASSWTGSVPTGMDIVADLLNNISANRTVTIDAGMPSSRVTLGGMRLGDLTGGNSFTISGGTLVFETSEGSAFLIKQGKGGNDTISSAILLNSQLDIRIADTNANSQGLTLSGKISGGVTGNVTIHLSADGNDDFVRHLLINNAGNDFAGQIVVDSGLLRLEGGATNAYAAGLRGVGNEVIVRNVGRVDLRDSDYNVNANDTEIFIIEGAGPNGLGPELFPIWNCRVTRRWVVKPRRSFGLT
jgi:hypothetical protein